MPRTCKGSWHLWKVRKGTKPRTADPCMCGKVQYGIGLFNPRPKPSGKLTVGREEGWLSEMESSPPRAVRTTKWPLWNKLRRFILGRLA